MVKIRLKRLGRKKKPFYRIVVTDIRNRRDGAPLAELGYYNPLSRQLKLNKAEALAWMAKGAQPTETTRSLIDRAPETGEVIQLERVRQERLSKKALAKQEELEKRKAEAKAAEEAAKAAPPPVEEPAAAEPVAEAAAEPAAESSEEASA